MPRWRALVRAKVKIGSGRRGSAWRFVPVFPGSGCQNKLCPRPEAGNTTSATLISFAEIIGGLWSSTRNWRPGSSPHWPSGYSALEHATTTTRPMMPAEPSPGGYPARFGAKARARQVPENEFVIVVRYTAGANNSQTVMRSKGEDAVAVKWRFGSKKATGRHFLQASDRAILLCFGFRNIRCEVRRSP